MCKNVQCTGKKMAVFLNDLPALQGFDVLRDSATESARLQKWLRIFKIHCILDRQGYERERYCYIVRGGGVQNFKMYPWQPGDGETKYSVVKKQFYDYFLSSNIVDSSIHVDMQDIYVNMRVIMLTSDLFMSTCELIMLTCKIFVSTCQITMFTCKLSLTTCEITCTC